MKYTFRFTILLLLIAAMLIPSRSYAQSYSMQSNSNMIVDIPLKFHYYSLIQKAENNSYFVYDGADACEPRLTNGFQTTLDSQIKGKRGIYDYWAAAIVWTVELKKDVHILGNVEIKAYMSSTSGFGIFDGGGYGMGLVDIDENGNEIKEFIAEGPQSIGSNPFSGTPKAYALDLDVDYVFKKGHYLGFFVGVGATIKGFTVNVYFDSPDRNSGAMIPIEDQTETYEFSAVWEGNTYKIVAISNSSLSNFGFNQPEKQISFNASGIRGTRGYCKVWIPKTLLEGPFKVSIDSQQILFFLPSTETENTTHSFIYFTYTHDPDTIKIVVSTTPPRLDHITIIPASKTLQVDSTQLFSAQGYDQNNNLILGLTYTWTVTGGIGFLNSTSGQIIMFTATTVASGSLSATATYGGITKSGSASITVTTTPTAVTLNLSDITQNSVKLTWTQNTEAHFAKYEIYQSTTSGTLGTKIYEITDRSVTSYTVTGLSADTIYYFTIRVVDTGGLFADSVQVSGRTTPLTEAGFTPPWMLWVAGGLVTISAALTITILALRRRRFGRLHGAEFPKTVIWTIILYYMEYLTNNSIYVLYRVITLVFK